MVDDNKRREKEYLKYLDVLGIDDKTYREFMKTLGIEIKGSEIPILSGISIGPVQEGMVGEDSEVRLGVNTVRKMGMIVDPIFLTELMINGIVTEMVFRPGKKGEISEEYRDHFRKLTLEQNWADLDWRKRHIK